MIKKRLTEYDSAASITDNDLFLTSKAEGDNFVTKKATANTLKTYINADNITEADLANYVQDEEEINSLTFTNGISFWDAWNGYYQGLAVDPADGILKIDGVKILTTGNYTPPSTAEASTPFNYMMLTKGFTTEQIGWTTDQLTFSPMTTSYGGFVSSAIDSLKSCKSYIELWIPPSATDFRSAGCINFSILTSESATTNNKVDVSIYQSSSSYGSPTLLKTLTGLTSTNATTPLLTTLNKFGHGSGTELVSAFGGSIITFVFTFYSFNSKFSALLSGNVNYVCG